MHRRQISLRSLITNRKLILALSCKSKQRDNLEGRTRIFSMRADRPHTLDKLPNNLEDSQANQTRTLTSQKTKSQQLLSK